MNRVKTSKLSLEQDGAIHVYPQGNSAALYQYVYRAATGVSWDNELCCFIAIPSKDESILECIERIFMAVRNELGIIIYLTAQCDCATIPQLVQTKLVAQL